MISQETKLRSIIGLSLIEEAVLEVLNNKPLQPNQISQILDFPSRQDPKQRVDTHAIIHGTLIQLMHKGKAKRFDNAPGTGWVLT